MNLGQFYNQAKVLGSNLMFRISALMPAVDTFLIMINKQLVKNLLEPVFCCGLEILWYTHGSFPFHHSETFQLVRKTPSFIFPFF